MKQVFDLVTKAANAAFFGIAFCSVTLVANAQVPVTSVTTGYTTDATGTTYTDSGFVTMSGHRYTYTYGSYSGTSNNDEYLTALSAGGVNYNFLPITSLAVKVRRVDNPVVQGIRELKFDEGTVNDTTSITIDGSYDDNMEHFFQANTNFNSGTDNIFTNQGDGNGNNNNIERLDIVIPHGMTAPDNSKIGLAIFERGNTGQHDPVKVAAILGVDASGNPTSYSTIISITSATYGSSDPVAAKNYVIERRDMTGTSHLLASTSLSQAIGGVFIRYSDFGIPNGTTIYGYSLIPNDFKGSSSADILNYTDSTLYPTNTSATDGGIDLVSFTGTLQSGSYSVLPVSMTAFTAQSEQTAVNLRWEVENAAGSGWFDVQKSQDGVHFNTIASVPAPVTSATGVCSYQDGLSLTEEGGVLYYRIAWMTREGRQMYSPVRQVVSQGHSAVAVVATYPNPTVNGFVAMIPANWQNRDLQYSVTGPDGRILIMNAVKGAGSRIQVDIRQLGRGLYVFHMNCGAEVLENKIIKM